MKNFFLIISICFFNIGTAQNLSYLCINPSVPEFYQDGLNEISKSNIENKLYQITTNFGVSGNSPDPIFIIRPSFIVESINTVRGLENQNVVKMEMILYIENSKDKVVYNSIGIKIKGIGVNQKQAYNNAITSFSTNTKQLDDFITKSKVKIVGYYNSKCENILEEAQRLANISNYEGAIYTLYAVPQECKECFNKTIAPISKYYKAIINKECKGLMLSAKTAYSQKLYDDVKEHLSRIDPESECYDDALKLSSNIQKQINDFDLTVYEDGISLENKRIDAIKEIAIAQAQKKEAETNNLIIIK